MNVEAAIDRGFGSAEELVDFGFDRHGLEAGSSEELFFRQEGETAVGFSPLRSRAELRIGFDHSDDLPVVGRSVTPHLPPGVGVPDTDLPDADLHPSSGSRSAGDEPGRCGGAEELTARSFSRHAWLRTELAKPCWADDVQRSTNASGQRMPEPMGVGSMKSRRPCGEDRRSRR